MNIRQKLLLPPGALLGLMLLLGVAGFMGLNSSNNSVRDIYDVRFQAFKGSSDALADVAAAHAGVYRLFTWLNNYDAARIKQATDGINQRIDQADAHLSALTATQALPRETRKVVIGLQKDLAEYRKQVMQAIDYAQIDSNMGMTGMQTADQGFTALENKAEKLVEKYRARAEALADEIEPTPLRELLYYLVDSVLDQQPASLPEPAVQLLQLTTHEQTA